MSSPTLRKLCLPCITARNHHPHQHNTYQKSNKNKTSKNNQRQIVIVPTTVNTAENNIVESSHRFEVTPRTYDPISTTPVVHSSEYIQKNDANHSYGQHQHFETLLPNERIEEKDDEISVKAEITPTEIVSESVLPSLSSFGNEITRSNEVDVVGTYIDSSSINLRIIIKNIIMSFIFFLFFFFFLFIIFFF